jgi:glycosyltransferase involved in cell wall biosynthesis
MTLLQANADVTPEVLRALPRAAIDGGHLIGYWYWELSSFPIEFSDRFSLLDEIWVASQFVHDAIAPVSPIPVKLVPPFVPNPQVCVFGRRRLFERERFVFFYSFDVGSVAERKNPFGAIETIRRLTSKTDRSVGLVLRVNRSELDRELVLSLRRSVRGLPIEIVTQRCTRRAFVELMAGCDAVLSLHRSEGLGLLPIEALWMGKPVVATAYGGVTDYLSPRTAFPVDFELVILDRDHPPYPRGSVWAEPDLDHAVHQMRLLIENGDDAQRRTLEGQRLVRSRFGLAAATHRYRRELARSFDHVLDPILSDGVRA